MVWLSHQQLYLYFQFAAGHPGPVHLKKWTDGSTLPVLSLINHPFRLRVRWFVKILKECLRHAGQAFVTLWHPAFTCHPISYWHDRCPLARMNGSLTLILGFSNVCPMVCGVRGLVWTLFRLPSDQRSFLRCSFPLVDDSSSKVGSMR